MREIPAQKIVATVSNLCQAANTELPEDVVEALGRALKNETSPLGRNILRQIVNNALIAREEKLPLCQDTGLAVVFAEVGEEVRITGGSLVEAVNEGVSRGYKEGFLRKSVVADPLLRENTGDNTPAILHTELVPGDRFKLQLMCKGGGAENRSQIKMFKPTSTKEEIEQFILTAIEQAGPNACPPLIVGVGLGGNFETAPLLAKKALLRPLGKLHSAPDTAAWERELFEKANKLGVGPMGLGGNSTVLAVQIERRPCHISSLPVAVNIECHAHRCQEASL